jgi:hypothetical protein
MGPRYIIVDKAERDEFEMKWQLPYGYNGCRIFNDEVKAIEFYKDNIQKYHIYDRYILEKYDNGTKQTISEDITYERT